MRGAVGGAKPKNASATINRLLAYIGRDKIKILFVFACVLGSSLATLPEAIFTSCITIWFIPTELQKKK